MVEHVALKIRLWSIISAWNLHQSCDFPIKVGRPFSFYTVWRVVRPRSKQIIPEAIGQVPRVGFRPAGQRQSRQQWPRTRANRPREHTPRQ